MWKRALLALGLAIAACKGDSKDRAPEPAVQPQPDDVRRADAAAPPAAPPPDVPTVDAAAGAPLPRQPGGIIVIDGTGGITVADAGPSWSGELPAQTQPLPEPELEKLWLGDRSGGSATRLALEGNLTPAKWRAARQRRAKERALRFLESPPSRMIRATVSARPLPDDEPRPMPVIFASPGAPARLLAKVLVLRGGTLVVRTAATPAAPAATRALAPELELYTGPGKPPARPWIELHLDDRGVHVLLIGNQPPAGPEPFARKLVAWGELDRASLGAALAEHAAATGSPPELDLVVTEGIPVKLFVDAIAHVHALGIRAFGIAEREAAPDRRHLQELSRDWIRRTIREHHFELTYCYEHRLMAQPDLAGTVTSSFHVRPDGRTALINATGMDADVADCVALVLEGLRFPPFDLPAGLSVNYPFKFRSAGGGAPGGP